MASELTFARYDNVPWGFRLTGGKDFEIPLTVVKVFDGTLAEKIGLIEGDTVVRINEHCTGHMTHEQAHEVITKAGNNFVMEVIRPNKQLMAAGSCPGQVTDINTYEDYPPIDQDICPITAEVPYPQIANLPVERSLTASPYFNPTKNYRPFSTEPIEGVPAVEEPIILDPSYHDDFTHIPKPDFEPDTIFKLERIVHKADEEISSFKKECHGDTQILVTKDLNNTENDIDLNAIEISAKEIVDDSIEKAVVVTEEIKKEIQIELSKSTLQEDISNTVQSTENNIKESSRKSSIKSEEPNSPTEKQMWVMTAEYNSRAIELERRLSTGVEKSTADTVEQTLDNKTLNCKTYTNIIHTEDITVNATTEVVNQGTSHILQEATVSEAEKISIKNTSAAGHELEDISVNSVNAVSTNTGLIKDMNAEAATEVVNQQSSHILQEATVTEAEKILITDTSATEYHKQNVSVSSINTVNTNVHHTEDISSEAIIEVVNQENSHVIQEVRVSEAEKISITDTSAAAYENQNISVSTINAESATETSHVQEVIINAEDSRSVELSQQAMETQTEINVAEKHEAFRLGNESYSTEKRETKTKMDVEVTKEEKLQMENAKSAKIENQHSAVEENKELSYVQDEQSISKSVVDENSCQSGKKQVEQLITNLKESESSLLQVKDQTLSAANTISKETKSSIIQRQIPAVGAMPSQHYTDQLLKTFFVHLTDVMIALSRMIVAETGMTYGSRSVSPMPPRRRDAESFEVAEEVVVKKTITSKSENIQQSSGQSSAENYETRDTSQKSENRSEVFGRIMGSTEEVEKLVESVEQTRKLAESVQQARKVSMTAEQSLMLAQSAEQLRRLSLTAEQTIQKDLAEHSGTTLEILSNGLSQVSQVISYGEASSELSSVCSQRRKSSSVQQIIDQVVCISENDATSHAQIQLVSETIERSNHINEAVNSVQEQTIEVTANHVDLHKEILEIKEEFREAFEESSALISNASEQQHKEDIEMNMKKTLEPLAIKDNEKSLQRTDSENSETGIAVEPPTPLTDEYVFHLDIHVKGLRSGTHTPEPPKIPEDTPAEHVSKKPRLEASITTVIESTDYPTNATAETNDEASIDDLPKVNESDLGLPTADANPPQLPEEIATARKSIDEEVTSKKTFIDKIKEIAIQNNKEVQNGEKNQRSEFKLVEIAIEPKGNAVENGVENIDATTNGVDDGKDKPGMTDYQIAVLISGEAEVLKDAHVLGLQRVLASHMSRVKDEEDDDPNSVNFKKIMPQCSFIKDSEVFKALNEEAVKTKEEKKKEERKWTTFLQTPNRPVPSRRGQFYEPEPKEKYQVKIVKQAKPKVAPDYPKSFETGLLPWEERLLNQPPAPPVEQEPPILIPEDDPLYLEALDNLPESAVPDLEDTGIPLPPEPVQQEESDPRTESQEEALGNQADIEDNQDANTDSFIDQTTESNLDALDNIVSEMADPNLPIEEQLAQVQAQLLALSQLPAAIQQTLELVTRQLSQIVPQATSIKQEYARQAEITDDQNTDVDGGLTTDEERLEEILQEPASLDTESVPHVEPAVEEPAAMELPAPQVDPEEVERIRREEEARIADQRKIDKQKKDLMAELQLEHQQRQVKQRPTPRVSAKPVFGPLAPQERPIFLPGGRKWRGPKDAYNDAFIAETLTKQAEIIQGKVLGVNFMKYEKPPISLEHLKESVVYKMVHDMDDVPLKGIEKKTVIPIAEDEFREKCRSVTPTRALDRQEVYEDHTVLPQQVQP